MPGGIKFKSTVPPSAKVGTTRLPSNKVRVRFSPNPRKSAVAQPRPNVLVRSLPAKICGSVFKRDSIFTAFDISNCSLPIVVMGALLAKFPRGNKEPVTKTSSITRSEDAPSPPDENGAFSVTSSIKTSLSSAKDAAGKEQRIVNNNFWTIAMRATLHSNRVGIKLVPSFLLFLLSPFRLHTVLNGTPSDHSMNLLDHSQCLIRAILSRRETCERNVIVHEG